jgi:prolyl-tRNA synthetase
VTDAAQMAAAEQLYQELNAAGIETILDDRDERAGVKFKDADLIGIPYRIVTGRSLQSGQVEVVTRSTKQSQEIPVPEVQGVIRSWIAASIG